MPRNTNTGREKFDRSGRDLPPPNNDRNHRATHNIENDGGRATIRSTPTIDRAHTPSCWSNIFFLPPSDTLAAPALTFGHRGHHRTDIGPSVARAINPIGGACPSFRAPYLRNRPVTPCRRVRLYGRRDPALHARNRLTPIRGRARTRRAESSHAVRGKVRQAQQVHPENFGAPYLRNRPVNPCRRVRLYSQRDSALHARTGFTPTGSRTAAYERKTRGTRIDRSINVERESANPTPDFPRS